MNDFFDLWLFDRRRFSVSRPVRRPVRFDKLSRRDNPHSGTRLCREVHKVAGNEVVGARRNGYLQKRLVVGVRQSLLEGDGRDLLAGGIDVIDERGYGLGIKSETWPKQHSLVLRQ